MNEAAWLPSREAVARVARYLGYPTENAQLRIRRYVKARRVKMRRRTVEGVLVYATGHGEIDWGDESIELCLDGLIEADLLPAPGRPEGLAERAWQSADRAIAYLIMGYLVERADWTPEMIRETEQGEIKLGEACLNGLSARGQKSLQGPIEQIPRNDFRSEKVARQARPPDPLRLPKVVVHVDGTVGVSPPHRLPDYMGPPWCFIEVEWAGLKPLRAHAKAEPAPAPPTELLRVESVAESASVAEEPSKEIVETALPVAVRAESGPRSELAVQWTEKETEIIEAMKRIRFPDGDISPDITPAKLIPDTTPAKLRHLIDHLYKEDAKAKSKPGKKETPRAAPGWDTCNRFLEKLKKLRDTACES